MDDMGYDVSQILVNTSAIKNISNIKIGVHNLQVCEIYTKFT